MNMKKNSSKTVYTESDKMMNPPKGYKKSVTNKPDPSKVKAYYKKHK